MLKNPQKSSLNRKLRTIYQVFPYNPTQNQHFQSPVIPLQYYINLNSKMAPSDKNTKPTTPQSSTTKTVQNLPPAVSSPTNEAKSTLQGWVNSTKDLFGSWSSQACSWCESQEVKAVNKARTEFATQYCHPLGDYYRSLPQDITSFKTRITGRYNYRERLFALEGLAFLVAVGTLKSKGSVGLSQRFLLSIRNSAITYLFGGLLIAPEIYNPFIKSDF